MKRYKSIIFSSAAFASKNVPFSLPGPATGEWNVRGCMVIADQAITVMNDIVVLTKPIIKV
jgi:hypothetical protein